MNMLSPKQKRATLMRVSFYSCISREAKIVNGIISRTGEKLFKMLPCVLSVKTRYADIASVQHATRDMAVEMCVTLAKRWSVGVRKLP